MYFLTLIVKYKFIVCLIYKLPPPLEPPLLLSVGYLPNSVKNCFPTQSFTEIG